MEKSFNFLPGELATRLKVTMSHAKGLGTVPRTYMACLQPSVTLVPGDGTPCSVL